MLTLAEVLPANKGSPSLLVLDLRGCTITDSAAMALTNGLRLSSVTDLDLSGARASNLNLAHAVDGLLSSERPKVMLSVSDIKIQVCLCRGDVLLMWAVVGCCAAVAAVAAVAAGRI